MSLFFSDGDGCSRLDLVPLHRRCEQIAPEPSGRRQRQVAAVRQFGECQLGPVFVHLLPALLERLDFGCGCRLDGYALSNLLRCADFVGVLVYCFVAGRSCVCLFVLFWQETLFCLFCSLCSVCCSFRSDVSMMDLSPSLGFFCAVFHSSP